MKIIDDIDLTIPNVFRGKERIERDRKIKKILNHCYGIKIKKVIIKDTKKYFGYTFYLPYCIMTRNVEGVSDLAWTLWNSKVYKTLEEILWRARNGELELI